MAWWKRGRKTGEVVTADWMGIKLADLFDPRDAIGLVRQWSDVAPSDPKPFIALASLSAFGFYVGVTQKSIRHRIDEQVMQKIQRAFFDQMLNRFTEAGELDRDPQSLELEIADLYGAIKDAFYSKLREDEGKVHPVWFAGKAVDGYLNGTPDALNPEEIAFLSQYLHRVILQTKELFDELLASKVAFVE